MKTKLPTIRLGKITLREVCEADYLDYFAIGCDPKTTDTVSWGPFIHPNDALYIIREIFMKRPETGLPVGYAICINGAMVGLIDFHTYYAAINAAEIGYILHRSYWNQGIMKKCLKAITDVGFRYLDYDKIIVGHTLRNEASKHVILACGYKYETQMFVKSKNGDELANYYALYRNEYEGGLI